MVDRATEQVSVLKGCVGSLHGLLRERNVATRDGVQVGLGEVLQLLHDELRLVDERVCVLL